MVEKFFLSSNKVGIYREREMQKINNTITFESSYWVENFRDYLTAEIV
jgi:hypothetical protein